MPDAFEHILLTRHEGYAVVTLNRPKVLNALSTALMTELAEALADLDRDQNCRAIVLTGSDRAFAAGADIAEMADADAVTMVLRDQFAVWDRLRHIHTPLIAAVSGYALGGGCELALVCDLIVASETARFGLPEITLGVIPGTAALSASPGLSARSAPWK